MKPGSTVSLGLSARSRARLHESVVFRCATKLGRNTRPLTQQTRDREIGDYGSESNMGSPLCHDPGGGFSSTTLGGDARKPSHRFTRINRDQNTPERPGWFALSGTDLC